MDMHEKIKVELELTPWEIYLVQRALSAGTSVWGIGRVLEPKQSADRITSSSSMYNACKIACDSIRSAFEQAGYSDAKMITYRMEQQAKDES